MIAVAFHYIVHIAQCQLRIGGVFKGLCAGITGPTLKENLPYQQPIFIVSLHHFFGRRRHIFIGYHVNSRQSQESSLVIHALTVHIQQHIRLDKAAPAEDSFAIYPKDSPVFAIAFLQCRGDFANAKGGGLLVRHFAIHLESELQLVQILHTIAVGPPQMWISNVQLRIVFWRESHGDGLPRRDFNRAFKHHGRHCSGHLFLIGAEVNLLFQVNRPTQNTSANSCSGIAKLGRNGEISIRCVGQLQVGDDVRMLNLHVICIRQVDILIDSHVAIAHNGRAIPACHKL